MKYQKEFLQKFKEDYLKTFEFSAEAIDTGACFITNYMPDSQSRLHKAIIESINEAIEKDLYLSEDAEYGFGNGLWNNYQEFAKQKEDESRDFKTNLLSILKKLDFGYNSKESRTDRAIITVLSEILYKHEYMYKQPKFFENEKNTRKFDNFLTEQCSGEKENIAIFIKKITEESREKDINLNQENFWIWWDGANFDMHIETEKRMCDVITENYIEIFNNDCEWERDIAKEMYYKILDVWG